MVRTDTMRALPGVRESLWLLDQMLLSLIGRGSARQLGPGLRALVAFLALPGILLGNVPLALAAIPVAIVGAAVIAAHAEWRDGRSLRKASALRLVFNQAQLLPMAAGSDAVVSIDFDSYRVELLDDDARPLDVPLTDLPVARPLHLHLQMDPGELMEAQIVAGSRARGEVSVYMICDRGNGWQAENLTVDFPTWKASLG